MYFQSRRLFIAMDVIGSFMIRDVFVAAPSVLTSDSTESVTCRRIWEISQREVVTDSPGRVDFPSWQFILNGHWFVSLFQRLADAVHANCLLVNCEFAYRRSESFWSWRTKRLMHAISDSSINIQFWVNSCIIHMYPRRISFRPRRCVHMSPQFA